MMAESSCTKLVTANHYLNRSTRQSRGYFMLRSIVTPCSLLYIVALYLMCCGSQCNDKAPAGQKIGQDDYVAVLELRSN